MRAYGKLHKCKHLVSIDCLTIQSKDCEWVLNLGFSEQDFGHKGFTETFRLKDECIDSDALELEFEVGNNEETYNFIRNGELCSVALYPVDIDTYTEIKPKLEYLVIYVGNRRVFMNTKNAEVKVYTEG